MSQRPTARELLDHPWPLALAMCPNEEDGAFDGSCPCAVIHGEGFEVETHCWRSACDHGCPYSCIHVSGTIDPAIMQQIAEHIRDNNGWTNATEWKIVICAAP